MDITRILTSEEFIEFNPILESWLDIIKNFQTKDTIRAPYWYTERANIGLFAAAATKNNWTTLEEFHRNKSKDNVKDKIKVSLGRLDLWLYNGSNSFFIEAKQVWPNITKKIKSNLINWSLEDAIIDAQKHKKSDQRLIAMSFIVPRIKISDNTRMDNRIQALVGSIKLEQNCFIAWSFLDKYHEVQNGDKFFPGIIVVAREVLHKTEPQPSVPSVP